MSVQDELPGTVNQTTGFRLCGSLPTFYLEMTFPLYTVCSFDQWCCSQLNTSYHIGEYAVRWVLGHGHLHRRKHTASTRVESQIDCVPVGQVLAPLFGKTVAHSLI